MDGIRRSQRATVASPPHVPARDLASTPTGTVASGVPVSGRGVRELIFELGSRPITADSSALIDELRDLEDLTSAISARQARVAVAFDLAQRGEQARAGVPAAERGTGVAAQVAMARRESPHKGSRLLGLAKALVKEMPRTLAELESGQLNEWRATLLVKETACLSVEDRAAVDEELAPDAGTFDGAGDKAIIAAAKAAAYRRDPRSVAQRASHAATERTVSLRPAPDTMTYLTALLPVAQGVAVYAALTRTADSVRSSGDERTRAQVMADTLTERVTGTPGGVAGVNLNLVMTDRTLFQGDPEPARLEGYGIVPAEWARALLVDEQSGFEDQVHRGREGGERREGRESRAGRERRERTERSEFAVLIRRLYTAPGSGELLAMDSKARFFPQRLRSFIHIRDNTCRTPYCDAPIRHIDHVIPWHSGGSTHLKNGAGLCEACNHTKETPGWTAKSMPGDVHTIRVSTPTGHSYKSKAPPLPGRKPTRLTN